MKTSIILLLLLCLQVIDVHAQDCDMPLGVVVPEQAEPLDVSAQTQITNKLRRIASQNGIGGSLEYSPFVITASVDVVNKEIISGSPVKYIYVLDVNLYIVDTQNQQVYASTTVEVRCAGNSQTKTYINGIKQINPSNKELQTFIEKGRTKMLDYYNTNYQKIIKQARSLASLHQYDEALFNLMTVPACSIGYEAATKELKIIYQQYVDRQCVENLASAKSAWLNGFSKESAAEAAVYLSQIYPDAACYGDAQELATEIKKHLGEEWKFEMKQWDDAVSIEQQKVKNAREIAIAFAEHQPEKDVSFIFR
jgi:hypothetical protein